MKKLFVILSLLALVGCSEPTPQPNWVRTSTNMHDVAGFEDCTYAELNPRDGVYVYVVRCPSSSVSTRVNSGKTPRNAVVVEKPHTK